MTRTKVISFLLILTILLPPANVWAQLQQMQQLQQQTQEQPQGGGTPPPTPQTMQDQAKFYLQRIGPGPTEQLAPIKPPPMPTPLPEPAKIITAAPRQPEETSAPEKRTEDNGMLLKQFGYSFFYKPPDTFLPVQAVPVGPDYVIGPEDTLRIVCWGSITGEYSITVDRNGNVSIPKVGVVHVSGLTYTQLRQVMEKEFARQYTNFQMNVTLDNLRTIQVFVVGQARFPGTYAVSSLSTLVSALFASGGPSKTGSMRNIQLRRGKKVITTFDMYDFLLNGDKSKDVRLQSDDVIFIPPIGPLAAIGSPNPDLIELVTQENKINALGVDKTKADRDALEKIKADRTKVIQEATMVGGAVKVPAIYELKNEKTLLDLLRLAGGMSDTAFKGRVQVLRIKDRQQMVMFEDDLGKVMSSNLQLSLVDGDVVKIFRVSGVVDIKVRVAGAVRMVGDFGYRTNMRVKDLVNYAGGLLYYANQEEAEITRVNVTPSGPETTRLYVNLRRVLAGDPKDNILLKPNDYLFVRTVPDWDLYTTVKITGEIKFPGTYAIKKGETLSSLLSRAGGFTTKAYLKGSSFTRVSVREAQAKHLKQAVDRIETEMYALASQRIQSDIEPDEAKRQQVFLRQQQLLVAKLREIVPLGRIVIRMNDPERLRGTPNDIELQDGDTVAVPQIQQSVNVLGSVVSPTAIIYEPYLTVKDYIGRVGGATKNADVKGTYIIKANGVALSRKSFGWFGGPNLGDQPAPYHLGGFQSMRLDPGDTIIVPEELEKIAWVKEIKDIATILGQIALTAGVVLIGLK